MWFGSSGIELNGTAILSSKFRPLNSTCWWLYLRVRAFAALPSTLLRMQSVELVLVVEVEVVEELCELCGVEELCELCGVADGVIVTTSHSTDGICGVFTSTAMSSES